MNYESLARVINLAYPLGCVNIGCRPILIILISWKVFNGQFSNSMFYSFQPKLLNMLTFLSVKPYTQAVIVYIC